MLHKNLSDMSEEELKALLDKLNERLNDTEEMRKAVLGQTGHHIPGSTAKKFAADIDEIQKDIDKVKNVLSAR